MNSHVKAKKNTVSKNDSVVDFSGQHVQKAYRLVILNIDEKVEFMAALRRVFSDHAFFSALVFVVLLFLFEEYVFDVPQFKIFQRALTFWSRPEIVILSLSSLASFLICCFFVQAALRSSHAFQVVYIFLFALSSLVQYGFWKAVVRFMVPADLRIAAATPLDTWKGAGVLFFDWRFILPVLVFVFWLFLFGKPQGWRTSFIRSGSLFLFITILSFSCSFRYSSVNQGLSLSSFYQTVTRFLIDSARPPKREVVRYSSVQTPQNNIVLIIDESIRADHLSIDGYERETTPFLDRFAKVENGFYNLGPAVAGATCSYPSNALLLTGVRPGLDDFQKTANYPTVFQYAKAMGYKTYYMDVQSNTLWNGLTDNDVTSIDSWLKAPDFGYDMQGDFRAADTIVKIVSAGSGNFIVLNKRGVHFLYEGSYPREAAVWLPLPKSYASDPVLVLNPYDNGVRYNVNTFFERLLINPKILENTTILYTSDHGQTLFENHVSWAHCKYTPQEAIVPLILIGRSLPPITEAYSPSHSNILPTILDLMHVPSEGRSHTYAPSLFSALPNIKVQRFFFDGSLHLIDFPDP